MFFDDRLATVLRQRASSDVGLRTQFRQLLDILGAQRSAVRAARDPSLVASAWLRMDALAQKIPSDARARMIREPGWRFYNPELAAHLADFEPEVASAALGRAQLSVEDWSALIPRLPVRARGFLRLRRDLPVDVETLLDRLGVQDRGLPSPPVSSSKAEDAAPPPAESRSDEPPAKDTGFDPNKAGRSEISALVERIAQFKRTREANAERAERERSEPRLPLEEDQLRPAPLIRSFGFVADAAGRIEWADSEASSMVIGARLIAPVRIGDALAVDPLARAFARRQPVSDAAITLDGAEAIAGKWRVNAQPRFTDEGNFTGYIGRFRRPPELDPASPSAAQREADRIRQLLHELRTPVTAVQGYAEVIQQQLFGSASHEYRALAAAIAADAARILAGFEELDRLARLETGGIEIEEGATDLAEIAQRTNRQLDLVLRPRMAGIELDIGDVPHIASIGEEPAEALMWRLLATLGAGCAGQEVLKAKITSTAGFARLTCAIPEQLLREEDLFLADAKPLGTAINAGLFGAGFALRLARAEARSAGGGLIQEDGQIVLTVPLADLEAEGEASEGP